MTDKIALTGIKPSGTPHLGNYLGMIKPALELAEKYRAFYFIADYHALTTVKDGKELRDLSYELAATLLALGLDPDNVVFYRQSDIPEVFELTWILSCFTSKGLLNRAHAYKAQVDENISLGREPDHGINSGLFFYPALMAADILIMGSHFVPVGLDQKQHLEITRDIATSFNNTFDREILVLPEVVIREEVMTIQGIDGRKMSKSYNNVIPIFAPPKQLRKQVMRIVTDSRPPEEPKNPDECNVFNIYKYFAPPNDLEAMRKLYMRGGFGYGEVKQKLYNLLESEFSQAREKFNELMDDKTKLDEVLLEGAEKARLVANRMMKKVRKAIGARHERGIKIPI